MQWKSNNQIVDMDTCIHEMKGIPENAIAAQIGKLKHKNIHLLDTA